MIKEYQPSYFNDFVCLAGSCPDSCCAGWQICIDEDTLAFYNGIGGEFGKRLKQNIATDDEGDSCFILRERRCPFLNEKNLCDIHIRLGQEHTCEVCREHPVFTELYDGFCERSLSASCPAANHLIFERELTDDTYPIPTDDGSDPLLTALIDARQSMICSASKPMSFDRLIGLLYEQSITLSNRFYEYNDAYEGVYRYNGSKTRAFELALLRESEILTQKWRSILTDISECELSAAESDRFVRSHEAQIRKAFAYFVYRYGLKAVNDEEIELNYAFIALCMVVCADIAAKTDMEYSETVRLFSKEIEHDTDNIEWIKDYIAERN